MGEGKCNATVKQVVKGKDFVPGVARHLGCKSQCSGSISKARLTGIKDDMCTGYSFNAKAPTDQRCILYKSAIAPRHSQASARRMSAGTTKAATTTSATATKGGSAST